MEIDTRKYPGPMTPEDKAAAEAEIREIGLEYALGLAHIPTSKPGDLNWGLNIVTSLQRGLGDLQGRSG